MAKKGIFRKVFLSMIAVSLITGVIVLVIKGIVLLVLVIISVSAISFYLSSRITRPLEQIRKGVDIIGKGNFDYKIKLKTGDEIEELAKAFNKMAMTLNESQSASEEERAGLEIKIKARIKELEELAESLEDKIQQRTKELQKRVEEMEKFHYLTTGRELKMVELKKEIKKLKGRK